MRIFVAFIGTLVVLITFVPAFTRRTLFSESRPSQRSLWLARLFVVTVGVILLTVLTYGQPVGRSEGALAPFPANSRGNVFEVVLFLLASWGAVAWILVGAGAERVRKRFGVSPSRRIAWFFIVLGVAASSVWVAELL